MQSESRPPTLREKQQVGEGNSVAPNVNVACLTSHDREQSGLDRRFARSVRDNMLAECAIQVVRLSAMVVLARALGAAEFGVFRVLMVMSFFAITLLQPGLAEALIQRREINASHESTAWWISVGLGLGGASVLYAGAPLIAWLMAMPALTMGARLICLPVFLDCLSLTSNARLRRELRFGILASAEVVAEVAFLATALGLLWTSLAHWSLMAGLAARVATRALILLIAAPRLPRARPTIAAARELRRFAATVWSGGLINVLSANADFLLVGRLLGASALGFYVLAWDLLRFVPDRLYRVAGRVAFPAFCLLQDNDRELAQAYLNFFKYIARVVLPVAACAAVAAPELIGTIYGSQWLPAAQPLRLLSLGLALMGLRTGIDSVYYAKARPSIDIYLHSTRVALIVAAVCGFSSTGLAGISAAMSGVEGLISIMALTFASVLLGLSRRELVGAALPGLRLALACLLATAVGKAVGLLCDASGPALIAFIALPPAAVFLWLEGSTLSAMVTGVFDFNPAAATQHQRS
jgi:O-antigen/teichoic acid export membrane protein